MNFIQRRRMMKWLDSLILSATKYWAADWYVMSVLDEDTVASHTYWTVTKGNSENYISELCSLAILVKLNRTYDYDNKTKLTKKFVVEKVDELITKYFNN